MRPISARPSHRSATRLAVAVAVLAPFALTACSSDSEAADGTSGSAKGGGKPATVTVSPSGSGVKAGQPIKVTADGGSITSVAVTDGKGTKFEGKLSADGRVWTSERMAAPGTDYQVTAATKTEGGTTGTGKGTFSTLKAEKVNKVTLAPVGKTIGIGHPVSIAFDFPVKNKAAVERALKITTDNNTQGSWGWVKDWHGKDRVDWRPKEYWKPGTKVALDARLNGVDSGPSGFFTRDYDLSFTIGSAQIVKVDLDNQRLTLERDGQQVRTIPVSGGTPGGVKRSWGGTTVLMSKEGTINMNSETVGLGDAYNKMVDYSMRLTWSGMYAHAAPWNAAYFGRANKSSGCIGMSTGEASAFYQQVRIGDPFVITGKDTKGVPPQGNGFSNWNESWEEWQQRSALR